YSPNLTRTDSRENTRLATKRNKEKKRKIKWGENLRHQKPKTEGKTRCKFDQLCICRDLFSLWIPSLCSLDHKDGLQA
ncbi:hypothetical protein ABK046_52070, partial [Streptomyces caeruleatus]